MPLDPTQTDWNSSATMLAFKDIRSFLRRVRTRLGLVTLTEGLVFLTLVMVCLLAASALAAWVGDAKRLPLVRYGSAGLAAVAVLTTFIRYVFLPWRRLRHDSAVARHIETIAPALGGGVLSCVELEASLGEQRHSAAFSVGLIAAHAEDTAARLKHVPVSDLVTWSEPKRLGQALGIVAVALGTAVFLFPDPFTEGAQALVYGVPPPHARPAASTFEERDIVVGDISYTLSYPAYTKLPSLTLHNTSGDVSALVGTHVYIRTRPLVPAASASILFDADPDGAIPLEVGPNGELSGELTVKRDGEFRFRIETPDGMTVLERTRRSVTADPDGVPVVDLLKPTDDLEVRSDNPVRLYFSAADDFGISRIEVVTEILGGSEPPLRRRIGGTERQRTFVGEGVVDLKQLALEPGETVACWLEVYDNNTLASEPQRTRSRKVHIKLHSADEQHNDNIEAQRGLVELMLDVLADRLESPIEHQRLSRYDRSVDAQGAVVRRTEILVSTLTAVADALKADPLARSGVEPILRDMAARYQSQIAAELKVIKPATGETRSFERSRLLSELGKVNESGILELESDIPWLDELIDRQHQREVVERARELSEAHRDMMKLFKELKESGDPAVRMELQRRIGQLSKKIDKLMAEMRRNAKPMPYENMNMNALEPGERSEGLRDLRSRVSKVEELLRDGKLDEAMELAESLGQEVQNLTAELEADLEETTGDNDEKEAAQLQALSGELEKAVSRQDSVHQQTQKLDDKARERLSKLIREKLAPQIAREMERIRELQRRLGKVTPDDLHKSDRKQLAQLGKALGDLRATLSQEDLGEALQMAREALDELRNLEREVGIGADRMKDRDGNTARYRKRKKNARRLRAAKSPAGKLVKKLEGMMPSADDLLDRRDQRRVDRLAEHQERVTERVRKMRKKVEAAEPARKTKASSPLEKALSEAEEAMGEAKQRLKEHQPGRAAGHEKQALDKLKDAEKALREQKSNQQRGRDAPGVNRQRKPVAIPEAERYSVPKEFRDSLLRSLKERAPARYERLIEQYYEALVQ